MNRQMSSSVYPVRLSGWSKYTTFLYESQKYCHILFGKEEVKDRISCGRDTGISKQVYIHSEIPESHLIIFLTHPTLPSSRYVIFQRERNV